VKALISEGFSLMRNRRSGIVCIKGVRKIIASTLTGSDALFGAKYTKSGRDQRPELKRSCP